MYVQRFIFRPLTLGISLLLCICLLVQIFTSISRAAESAVPSPSLWVLRTPPVATSVKHKHLPSWRRCHPRLIGTDTKSSSLWVIWESGQDIRLHCLIETRKRIASSVYSSRKFTKLSETFVFNLQAIRILKRQLQIVCFFHETWQRVVNVIILNTNTVCSKNFRLLGCETVSLEK